MGQMAGVGDGRALDVVITNALVIDWTGIYKADIGIKNGRIAGIGKAGNPDVMAGVTPRMVVGVTTEAIAGEGLILTAGGVDTHIHFICPQQAHEAIASGVTTMLGGGTGPATGTSATTCTPGRAAPRADAPGHRRAPAQHRPHRQGQHLDAERPASSRSARAPSASSSTRTGAPPRPPSTAASPSRTSEDVQVTIHTDTLNESGYVDDSIAAFKGRTIHTLPHGGRRRRPRAGHHPRVRRAQRASRARPTPRGPYTVNTLDEHLDMLMVCHHLDREIPEDVAFAESRIRGETIAAEDVLHDLGAISIISSDSQAMGRVGEVITRTWQTADKMSASAARSPAERGDNDNLRIRRYVAKYIDQPRHRARHGARDRLGRGRQAGGPRALAAGRCSASSRSW